MSRWLLLIPLLAACGSSSPSGPPTCSERPVGGMEMNVDCHAAVCQCGAMTSTKFADRCADVCAKTQPFHCEQLPQQVVWTISNLACAACAGIDGGANCP